MAVCNLASEGLNSTTITPDQAQRKLYVGGLSPETTTELLLSFFQRHGEIEEGSVAYDKDTAKSRLSFIYFFQFCTTLICDTIFKADGLCISMKWFWVCYFHNCGGSKESYWWTSEDSWGEWIILPFNTITKPLQRWNFWSWNERVVSLMFFPLSRREETSLWNLLIITKEKLPSRSSIHLWLRYLFRHMDTNRTHILGRGLPLVTVTPNLMGPTQVQQHLLLRTLPRRSTLITSMEEILHHHKQAVVATLTTCQTNSCSKPQTHFFRYTSQLLVCIVACCGSILLSWLCTLKNQACLI